MLREAQTGIAGRDSERLLAAPVAATAYLYHDALAAVLRDLCGRRFDEQPFCYGERLRCLQHVVALGSRTLTRFAGRHDAHLQISIAIDAEQFRYSDLCLSVQRGTSCQRFFAIGGGQQLGTRAKLVDQ